MLNGEPMVSPITDHGCMRVASQIASESFQIDNAYCCDVGIVNGLPKVIELNYFSAAGFYACDVEKLFEAVGKEAERDYLDIMGD